jgi:hypothetical protein
VPEYGKVPPDPVTVTAAFPPLHKMAEVIEDAAVNVAG